MSSLYGANAFGGVINRLTAFNAGFQKGHWEGSVAGTLCYTDGPRFTNPYYNASFVDNAYSYKGELSYHAERATTTITTAGSG
jgi:outer membrane receptor for ferrienterochelin and colicin